MTQINLSARDLRAVLALADEGNFTRAAQRLHLSQPAFSALIQAVEDGLGARLFDRTTRQVTITPEGQLLVPSARRLLADMEAVVSDFQEHASARKGRVAVAGLPSLAAGWLPGVFAEFRAAHPGVELHLVDALAEPCKALLRARQVDVAVATAGPHDRDLRAEVLCADEFHVVFPIHHPLARRRTIVLRDLVDQPFVHLSRSSSVRQHLEAAFHPAQMRTVAEVDHLATVSGLVAAGMGVSVVPALTLFHFVRPDLAIRPFDCPGLTREIRLLCRQGESLSAAATALFQLMLRRRPDTRVGTRKRRNAAMVRQRT